MSQYKDTLDKVRFSEKDKDTIYQTALSRAPKGFQWGLVYKPLVVMMAMITLFFAGRLLFSSLQRPDTFRPSTADPATAELPLTSEPSDDEKAYPWNETVIVDKLPVYKNESLWVDTAYQGGLSNMEMTDRVKMMAAEFGVAIDHPFEAGNWDGTVTFNDPSELKTAYNTIYYSGEELEFLITRSGLRTIYVMNDNLALAEDIVNKLLKPMSVANYSLGFMDPVVLKQADTASPEAQTSEEALEIIPSQLLAFEKGDTFQEQLYNYEADRLEMVQAEGVIAIQRYMPETTTVRLIQEYKVITLEEAKQQLAAGHYITGEYFPKPTLDQVTAVELHYDLNRESNYFIPYYVFEVTFPKTGGSDQMYYAVQAVEQAFNLEHPDYVRSKEAILPGR